MSPCRSLGGPSAPGGRQRQCRQAWSGWNEATKPPRSDCLAVRTPPNAPATYIWRTNARGTMRTQPRPGRRGQPRAGRRGRSCAGRRGRNRARDDADAAARDEADAAARDNRARAAGRRGRQRRRRYGRWPPLYAFARTASRPVGHSQWSRNRNTLDNDVVKLLAYGRSHQGLKTSSDRHPQGRLRHDDRAPHVAPVAPWPQHQRPSKGG